MLASSHMVCVPQESKFLLRESFFWSWVSTAYAGTWDSCIVCAVYVEPLHVFVQLAGASSLNCPCLGLKLQKAKPDILRPKPTLPNGVPTSSKHGGSVPRNLCPNLGCRATAPTEWVYPKLAPNLGWQREKSQGSKKESQSPSDRGRQPRFRGRHVVACHHGPSSRGL